jgi:hypothetical protein
MAEMQRKIGTFAGQRVIAPGISNLFGKEYVWLQDHDGTIYILPLDENGVPQFV